jgi:hypothetical protein
MKLDVLIIRIGFVLLLVLMGFFAQSIGANSAFAGNCRQGKRGKLPSAVLGAIIAGLHYRF